jgi:hypothetical protein
MTLDHLDQLDYAALTNPAALAANRAGTLTPEQRARLERGPRASGACLLVSLVVVGAGFLAPTVVALGVLSGRGVSASPVSLAFDLSLALIGVGLLALGIYAPIGMRRQRERTQEELAAGVVAQGEGVVAFSTSGYLARLEWTGQPLQGMAGAMWRRPRRVNLPPGRYRFYYLPRTGALLSAEPLDGAGSPQPVAFARPSAPPPDPLAGLPGYVAAPLSYLAGQLPYLAAPPVTSGPLGAVLVALAEGNRFTMEELTLNRAGRLSARQRRRLLAPLFLLMPFGLIFTGASVTLWVMVLLGGQPLIAWAYSGTIFGGIGLLVLVLASRPLADAVSRRVVATEGLVTRDTSTDDESRTYHYKVNGLSFQVTARGYAALVVGLRYRIYYLPRSKTLASIEPLSEG